MNAQSTGHAQRDFASQPYPGNSNLVIAPGRHALAEMIKSIERGVIVYDLLGAGQSNLLAGDFSANIGLGYTIEKGRITGRVKDAFTRLYRNQGVDASTGLPAVPMPTGKCLGGTTVVNMGTCFRAPENVKKQFPQFKAVEAYADLMKLIKGAMI